MLVTVISVAAMILVAIVAHFLEAMGVCGAGTQLLWVLFAGFGGIICAIERNGRGR